MGMRVKKKKRSLKFLRDNDLKNNLTCGFMIYIIYLIRININRLLSVTDKVIRTIY